MILDNKPVNLSLSYSTYRWDSTNSGVHWRKLVLRETKVDPVFERFEQDLCRWLKPAN